MVNEQLAQLSNTLIYSAMAAYTIALLAFTIDLSGRGRVAGEVAVARTRELVGAKSAAGTTPLTSGASVTEGAGQVASPGPQRRRAAGIGVALTWLGFLIHAGGVVTRGLSADRVPWGNMYEFSISGALVVIGVYLVTLFRTDLRYLGTFVVGPVLLSIGLGVTVFYTQSAQLVPALQSFWLVIHVSVAFIASALLTLGFSLTVLQLVQDRRESLTAAGSPPKGGRFMDQLPTAVELERSAYRLHAVAFPLWTFTLMAGAIWAEKAWGRYWNWDPKEVWTFVIWVAYACYLHARATRGWEGRRAAYLALLGFACVLFNWFVINIFFTGLHSYAGIGKSG